MKNVAATSGHSVNFADLFLGLDTAREPSRASREMAFNLFRFPPPAILALPWAGITEQVR
jgi:hypothetical protein